MTNTSICHDSITQESFVSKKKLTSQIDTVLEMADRIKKINQGGENKPGVLPLSDTCYKKHFADICESNDKMLFYLRLLDEAHFIFTIHLVENDPNLMMDGVSGYVIAESAIIETLLASTSISLEAAYEQQFYKRSSVSTIIRQLLPDARIYNNTPLGRVLNITVMLQQFTKVLRAEFESYTSMWKKNKLKELFSETGMGQDQLDTIDSYEVNKDGQEEQNPDPDPVPDFGSEEVLAGIEGEIIPSSDKASMRAVDSPELKKLQEMDKSGQWGQAVEKYGAQFLLRVHLRKYEFDRVRWLIQTGKIAKEEDLRFIRDSIRKMESRYEQDPGLNRYKKQMSDVKRGAQLRLNKIFQLKKSI